MSIYDPLTRWLAGRPDDEVTLTISEIERIIAGSLPESANTHPAWWANEDPEKTRHVQSRAWRLAGWRAYPHLEAGAVTLRKSLN